MMKKTVSLMLALVLCLSLCACGHTHTYGDAVQVQEVNCTQDGITEKTCTDCGEKVTDTVASPGHTFKAATAFAPKTCSTCGLTEGDALAKVIAKGDLVEAEDHSFTVEKVDFTAKLKEKRGNVTYNHSSDFSLAIKLNFTNLATEAFERWSSDRVEEVSLEYKGKYTYEGEYWIPADDIVPLAEGSVYIVYEVPESMSEDTTSEILATFTIDGVCYAMAIQEGDGSGSAAEEEPAEAVDVSGAIVVGDTRTNESTFSFEVDDVYYTKKPSFKQGNVTYSFGTGGYYLACKLDFTNLSSEALESWGSERISDMSLKYADKYTYDGQMWVPGNEIVPLDKGYVFVLFEVSEAVENGTEPLVMKFTVDGSEFTMNIR